MLLWFNVFSARTRTWYVVKHQSDESYPQKDAVGSFCTYLLSPDFHIACSLCLPLLTDHEATPFSSAHGHTPVSFLQKNIVDRACKVERGWCRLLSTYPSKLCLPLVNMCNPFVLGYFFPPKSRGASNATHSRTHGPANTKY